VETGGADAAALDGGPMVDASNVDAPSVDATVDVQDAVSDVTESADTPPEADAVADSGPVVSPDAGVVFSCRMLGDLNPGRAASAPGLFVAAGQRAFFAANDGQHGNELWVTDGTSGGTHMTLDIAPGAAGSLDYYPWTVAVGDVVYFLADDQTHGEELWRSDGTASGTYLVTDLAPGSASPAAGYLTALPPLVVFTTTNLPSGPMLYRSDGTAGGTFGLVATSDSAAHQQNEFLTVLGSDVYFTASDATHGLEVWRSDGTVAGTSIVADVNPGPVGSNPLWLTAGAGAVYFQANDGQHGPEPWVTTGTAASTVLLADLYPGPSGSYPYNFGSLGNRAYFSAMPPSNADDLYQTDGTPGGTVLFHTFLGASEPGGFTAGGGQMVFRADDGSTGTEPYRTDGTVAGTYLLGDLYPGRQGSDPYEFTFLDGVFYFRANDPVHGKELWRSDGTIAGTYRLTDINPGAPDGDPAWLAGTNGVLYFAASDDVHGTEPWRCGFEPPPLDAGAADGGGGVCPSTVPPSMVRVGAYCIDSTEVTNADYQAFLQAKGTSTDGQPAGCSNPSFAPSKANACSITVFDPVGQADYPVVCVDWCDAATYCLWAGKRLCGGTAGGSTPNLHQSEPGQSQWMNACSAGGTVAYPYGNTYEPARCVDAQYNVTYADAPYGAVQPVMAAARCEGGFRGIFGMSGNAAEWEDSCGTGSCSVRGGDGAHSDAELRCDSLGTADMGWVAPLLSFRCCGEVR
jgi:ELWxxDGT repeat protein